MKVHFLYVQKQFNINDFTWFNHIAQKQIHFIGEYDRSTLCELLLQVNNLLLSFQCVNMLSFKRISLLMTKRPALKFRCLNINIFYPFWYSILGEIIIKNRMNFLFETICPTIF